MHSVISYAGKAAHIYLSLKNSVADRRRDGDARTDDPDKYTGTVITAESKIDAGGPSDCRQRPAEGGYFVPPPIIADLFSRARILQEEIFGPMLAATVTVMSGLDSKAGCSDYLLLFLQAKSVGAKSGERHAPEDLISSLAK